MDSPKKKKKFNYTAMEAESHRDLRHQSMNFPSNPYILTELYLIQHVSALLKECHKVTNP